MTGAWHLTPCPRRILGGSRYRSEWRSGCAEGVTARFLRCHKLATKPAHWRLKALRETSRGTRRLAHIEPRVSPTLTPGGLLNVVALLGAPLKQPTALVGLAPTLRPTVKPFNANEEFRAPSPELGRTPTTSRILIPQRTGTRPGFELSRADLNCWLLKRRLLVSLRDAPGRG